MSEMELKYCLEERVAWLVIGKAGSNWTREVGNVRAYPLLGMNESQFPCIYIQESLPINLSLIGLY